jgi:beta-carotene hydroxylase
VKLPSIDELGRDLLSVSPLQRALSVLRPVACVAAYFIFAIMGWWIPAVCAVAGLMFITYISSSHDLLHRTLGYSRRTNELLLGFLELLALRSGHAFRVTHLCHHRHFPADEDIEGRVARMPLWRALLAGIGHQSRLFYWAWHHGRTEEKRWMFAEACGVLLILLAGLALVPRTKVLLVYTLLVAVSSWLYPVATVWIPHRAEGKNVLFQTRALRGRLVPELFLQHTYHLEHHLYPSVPSYHWRELARRLDPFLQQHGVRPIQTP